MLPAARAMRIVSPGQGRLRVGNLGDCEVRDREPDDRDQQRWAHAHARLLDGRT